MLVATALVMKELLRKRSGAEKLLKTVVPAGLECETAEALWPFLDGPGYVRGEHEVIAFGHVMHKRAVQFTVIIDDAAAARRFALEDFAHPGRSMTGTLGFVVECHRDGILAGGDDAERVLDAMKPSRFGAPDGLVDEALREVRDS